MTKTNRARKIRKSKVTTQKRLKMFDYTAIGDRLKKFIWRNWCMNCKDSRGFNIGFNERYVPYARWSISVQFHSHVRWCFVNKQPTVCELPGPNVSCWTWDQKHDREQHFCFFPGFKSVDREGWSTSIYDKHNGFNFNNTSFLFMRKNIQA